MRILEQVEAYFCGDDFRQSRQQLLAGYLSESTIDARIELVRGIMLKIAQRNSNLPFGGKVDEWFRCIFRGLPAIGVALGTAGKPPESADKQNMIAFVIQFLPILTDEYRLAAESVAIGETEKQAAERLASGQANSNSIGWTRRYAIRLLAKTRFLTRLLAESGTAASSRRALFEAGDTCFPLLEQIFLKRGAIPHFSDSERETLQTCITQFWNRCREAGLTAMLSPEWLRILSKNERRDEP